MGSLSRSLLALVAGFCDTATFIHMGGVFSAHVTGNFVLFAMLLSAVHLFFMGFEGWLSPAGWHGGLPPISLVAFIVFAVGYLANLIGRN